MLTVCMFIFELILEMFIYWIQFSFLKFFHLFHSVIYLKFVKSLFLLFIIVMFELFEQVFNSSFQFCLLSLPKLFFVGDDDYRIDNLWGNILPSFSAYGFVEGTTYILKKLVDFVSYISFQSTGLEFQYRQETGCCR